MKWQCTKCGCDRFEEVMEGVTVTSDCFFDGGRLMYGEQTNEDGDVARYQCRVCGMVINDPAGGLPVIGHERMEELYGDE